MKSNLNVCNKSSHSGPFEPWIALTIGLERYIECTRDVDVYQSDKNCDENTTKIQIMTHYFSSKHFI